MDCKDKPAARPGQSRAAMKKTSAFEIPWQLLKPIEAYYDRDTYVNLYMRHPGADVGRRFTNDMISENDRITCSALLIWEVRP